MFLNGAETRMNLNFKGGRLDSSGRHHGLVVSVLHSGMRGPVSSLGQGLCVVFLGKTLLSQCTSLHPWGINGYWQKFRGNVRKC